MQTSFFGQFKALMKKNILLKKRAKRQFIQEFLYPVYFTAILAVIKLTTKTDTQDAIPFMPAYSLDSSGVFAQAVPKKNILVSPDTQDVRNIVSSLDDILQQMLNLSTVPHFDFHADSNSMEDAYRQDNGNISIGLIFKYQGGSNYTYAIRAPYDDIPDTTSWQREQSQCRYANGLDSNNCLANQYLFSGFSFFQLAVDTAILRLVTGNMSYPVPQVSVQMMPKPAYTPDTNYIQTISAIYLVIAYSPFVTFLTTNLVAEKEKKIKEGMKMMGLRDSAFWLSWSLTYFVVVTLATVLTTIIILATQFFSNSNVFIFFLIMMLYGLSIITMSCVMTTFFEKAQTAGGLASLMSIIFSLFYLIVSQTRTMTPSGAVIYAVSPGVRWLLCLLSPVAVALAIDQAIFLDKPVNGGMNFDTISVGDFPLYAPMVMMFIDFILYFILAVYLDNVIPGSFGAKQKPWYFLMQSYWCSKKDVSPRLLSRIEYGEDDGEYVESVPPEISDKLAVRVLDIHKEFKSDETGKMVAAVDGLSLDIYEDQITALLGHNGAGKTTLVNMMTGLLPPTKGTASVLGLDVSNNIDMQRIRTMTGICPQHNILFDDLSCVEHLNLFAGIKGVPEHMVQSETETALKNVDLWKEKDTSSKNLSGGQKRKLSVAIALIGDPKIIFLDEPTAGMDPYSRRQLWSLLKNKKERRVILLTTHFMDEADILADRKAIISKGKLRCCGSSLFLKSKFGIGYHLNMMVDPGCSPDRVTDVVKQCVPGGELQRVHGKELAYTLPLEEVSSFAALFSTLEKQNTSVSTFAESMGIRTYGVSMTSLEEVFLKLEEDDSSFELKEVIGPKKIGSSKTYGSMGSIAINDVPHSPDDVRPVMTMEAAMATSRVDEKDLRSQQFWALCKIRFKRFIRSGGLIVMTLILPVVFVLAGLLVNKYVKPPLADVTPVALYLQNAVTQYARLAGGSTGTPPLVINDSVASAASTDFMNKISTDYTTKEIGNTSELLSITPHHMGVRLTEYTVSGLTIDQGYTALYNDSAIHSLPAVINLMSNRILKALNISSILSVVSLPWPKLNPERSYDQSAFSSTILVAMAFITIPPGFAVELVKDRQFKIRSQMRVSGVTFWMYWASTFFVDVLKYCIPAVFTIIVVLAMQPPSLKFGGAVVSMLLLILFYVPSNTLAGYIMSFAFDKYESCQAAGVTLFFFASFIPYIVVAMVDMLSNVDAASYVHYAFCVVDPPYTIFGGLYYIDRNYRLTLYDPRLDSENIPFGDYFNGQILVAIIMPLVHCVLAFFFMRMLDIKKTGGDVKDTCPCLEDRKKKSQVIPFQNEDAIDDEDEDVTRERQRVATIKSSNLPAVAYIQNLRKEFVKEGKPTCKNCKRVSKEDKTKAAVRNATYAVDAGEIFGLLGPNGAGKTTTLNMMIAETGPTKGQVMIGGYDIHSCMSEAFEAMGYCPQHDAVWDTITLKEHIECYAKIRGVPSNEISAISDYFVENMKIDEHKNKKAKKLSGGTKRKLSYIMSILGRPKIVLLDEPSTGMDPQSKRFLWDTISSCFVGTERGAILTTHYMEEADALCSRVAIMVNGKIQCLGSSQHLKDKYGSGYLLEIKLKLTNSSEALEDRMESLEEHILSLFPDATCLEKFAERVHYRLPNDCVRSLAETFSALEKAKTTHSVEEYSFSQATLEQVFLQFARQQMDEENAEGAQENGAVPQVLIRSFSQEAAPQPTKTHL